MEFNTLASQEDVDKAVAAMAPRGFKAVVVKSGADALEEIKKHIPAGASVMNGASVTLEQIGFVEYLKSGTHGWNNLHQGVLEEKDPVKQAELRRHSVVSGYYLGSAHALSQTGEILIASNTGSQLPHLAYTSPNLILVISTKKITPTLSDAMERLEKHVIPLEDVHMQQKYGVGTAHNKTLILHAESSMTKRNVVVLLVQEDLGF